MSKRGTRRGMQNLQKSSQGICEQLESRMMMCMLHTQETPPAELRPDLVGVNAEPGLAGGQANIVWVNRGQASDGFGTVFGSDAGLARSVVDRVLIDFMQMIQSFNYSDGSTNYNLTVSMDTDDGAGGAASLATTLGGKPKSGSLTLLAGDDGSGSGWFLDPDAALNFNSAEFEGNIVHAFSGDATTGGDAEDLADLYTVVAAEVAHCLGLFGGAFGPALWNARNTDTNIIDNAEGGGTGTFWVFEGPSIDHLMTSNNAGAGGQDFNGAIHTAGPTANINFGGTNWRGTDDAGNAIFERGTRYLIPDTLGLMFHDAYNYTVAPANTRDGFHSILNRQTGDLLIRGGFQTNSADDISVSVSGSNILVSVDVGNDVPGTGALPGVGDLPAYTSSYFIGDVDSIIIEGRDGNDDILIDAIPANIPISIFANDGNDLIRIGDTSNTLNGVDSNISILGGAGTNTVTLEDTTGDAFDDTYTFDTNISNTTFDRTGFPLIAMTNVQEIELRLGGGFETVNVNQMFSSVDLTVFAGVGNDTLNVSPVTDDLDNVQGDISWFGEGGTDTVNVFDTADILSTTFSLLDGGVSHILDRATFGSVSFGASTEAVNLSAGLGSHIFNVAELNSPTTFTINAGNGSDTLNLGSSQTLGLITGNVVFNGEAGTADVVTLNDQANAVSGLYVVTQNTVDRPGFGLLTFATTETVTLNGGSAGNPFDIDPGLVGLSTDVILNGGAAADLLSICPTSQSMQFVINADITFNGGGGSDQLYLFDGGSSVNFPYAIDNNSVTRGLSPVNYSSVEFINVDGATGANDFTVSSLLFSTDIALAGNAGNDRLFVGGTAQVLGNIDGLIDFIGGPGTDSMEMRDTGTANATTYVLLDNTFDSLEFSFLTYATAESLIVQAGSGANTYRAYSTIAGVNYTLNAGAANDTFHLGTAQNHVDLLDGSLTLNGNGGSDTANVNDSAEALALGFTITNTTITRTGMAGITYGTLEALNINAGNVAGSIGKLHNVESTPAGMQTVLNAGSGNDNIRLSNSATRLSNLLGPVIINGQGGTDSLTAQDAASPNDDVYSIDGTTLQSDDSALVTYGTVESLVLNAGSGDSDINVSGSAATTSVTVNAGPGSDSINLSQLNAIDASIVANGDAGNNVIFVDDQILQSDAYTLTATTLARTGFAGLTYGTVDEFVLLAQNGNNNIVVNATSTAVTIDANDGTDFISVVETISQGEVLLVPSPGNDTLFVNTSGVGSAGVILSASHTLAALNVGFGGFVNVEANGARLIRTASLTVNGTLDLNNNSLIVDYTSPNPSPLLPIKGLLTTGYNNGTWNGPGIRSSVAASTPQHALGYAEASALSSIPPIFGSVDQTAVLIRYTRIGDADLSGNVNVSDFTRVASSFGQTGTVWSQGNFNFDNFTNVNDFSLLASNFGLASA